MLNILSSKNFEIELGNGDELCLNDIFSKADISKGYWGEIINSKDFLKKSFGIIINFSRRRV